MENTVDVAYKLGAGRYIQAPGALRLAGQTVGMFGKNALVLGGATALSLARESLEHSFEEYGIRCSVQEYSGYTDSESAEGFAARAGRDGFDVVVGVGGGRIMDLAKAVAHLAERPVVTVPTSAATCAAYTPMSVMYTPRGQALGTAGGNFYHPVEVAALLVDEELMSRQPERFIIAGMLDAMAKYIEIQNGHSKITPDTLSFELYTAYTMSRYIYDYLYRNWRQIIEDIRAGVPTGRIHDFLYINFALTGFVSGCSKALGQTALAHELYYAARMFFTRQAKDYLHGEIVGTGLILQLYYNGQQAEASSFMRFMEALGAPVSLAQLGIPETKANRDTLFQYLLSTQFVDDSAENRARLRAGIDSICRGG